MLTSWWEPHWVPGPVPPRPWREAQKQLSGLPFGQSPDTSGWLAFLGQDSHFLSLSTVSSLNSQSPGKQPNGRDPAFSFFVADLSLGISPPRPHLSPLPELCVRAVAHWGLPQNKNQQNPSSPWGTLPRAQKAFRLGTFQNLSGSV